MRSLNIWILICSQIAYAFPNDIPKRAPAAQLDPFAVLDPQQWVNPDAMTWADFRAPPGTNWSSPLVRGSSRNFNIALLLVDYPDRPFIVTQPAHSTIFSNPQPSAANLSRAAVPAFYRDFLNLPSALNQYHTLHEYWMEDSGGRFGVDLTAFGAYQLGKQSWQYGIANDMNPGECPAGSTCNQNLRTDALAAWRAEVGSVIAASFELVFILSAGQDESSTWQEFGEMKFQTKEDVPAAFGPPTKNSTRNYAKTRYVEWTSWASASTLWPNAGSGSSIQGESSGMATYAHELSHLLNIGDNYNNPYGLPLRRAYTGPWSMMSRGSFNGPGGPHTRWLVPAQLGGSMGSLHTVRDKDQLGLISPTAILRLSRTSLLSSGLAVVTLTARAVAASSSQLSGLRIAINDTSPPCTIATNIYCDGGGYNTYDVEVVDRMGMDSFQPDAGVMISKSKTASNSGTFQWVIDANPQDIGLLDFKRPRGEEVYVTLGDYRQLADALFHAGTRSGSQYEWVDAGIGMRFFVVGKERDALGVLHYVVAAQAVNATSPHRHAVTVGDARGVVTSKGEVCTLEVKNTGAFSGGANPTPYFGQDVYRVSVESDEGWNVTLPNALVAVPFGSSEQVVVGARWTGWSGYRGRGRVVVSLTSLGDERVVGRGSCVVGGLR